MILHLVTKHFYSNTGLAVFEKRAPGQNIILVIDSMPNSVTEVNGGIEVTEENVASVVKSLDFSKINQVVMHYLTGQIAKFVHSYIPEGLPLYWWTYGGDLYFPYLQRRGFNIYYTDLTPFRFGYPWMLKRFVKTIINRLLFKVGYIYDDKYMQRELLERIEGIIPCIPSDHQEACRYLKKEFKLVRVHPFECPSYNNEFNEGNIVAIGHSASISDNHLYALKYIETLNLKDFSLSLTLSYNFNDKRYLEIVKNRYREAFKEKVSFIESMLSKEDYYKSQNELRIMIIPSWRQEALANVVSSLLKGIKLFLSKKSPMYNHFLNYGFKIFAIEDLNQVIFDTPLTLEEKKYNRSLMLKYLDEKERLIDEDFKLYFGNN